ncbi:MAG: hypothetical protein AAF654_11970 [Myxococcota bacterium]
MPNVQDLPVFDPTMVASGAGQPVKEATAGETPAVRQHRGRHGLASLGPSPANGLGVDVSRFVLDRASVYSDGGTVKLSGTVNDAAASIRFDNAIGSSSRGQCFLTVGGSERPMTRPETIRCAMWAKVWLEQSNPDRLTRLELYDAPFSQAEQAAFARGGDEHGMKALRSTTRDAVQNLYSGAMSVLIEAGAAAGIPELVPERLSITGAERRGDYVDVRATAGSNSYALGLWNDGRVYIHQNKDVVPTLPARWASASEASALQAWFRSSPHAQQS